MKYLDITFVTWKWQGRVLVGGTFEDFKRYAKRWIDADVLGGENSCGHAYVAYGQPWLLWVESLKNVPALAHEALHVTTGVLEGRGLKHTAESEEAYTYTMEQILREVLTAKRWRQAR